MKKSKILHILLLVCAITSASKAETVSIYDDSFSVSGTSVGVNFLGVRWGTWNSETSTFTQLITTNNDGYVDLAAPEFAVTLNQTTNTTYAQNTQFAIAIYSNGTPDSSGLNWSSSYTYKAILTDTSWIAPLFNNNATMVNYTLGAATTAVIGSYSFNSDSQMITLIPEPSSASLLVSGLLGLWLSNRRNKTVRG